METHSYEQKRHGFCCNACRFGETYHTRNCSGRGTAVNQHENHTDGNGGSSSSTSLSCGSSLPWNGSEPHREMRYINNAAHNFCTPEHPRILPLSVEDYIRFLTQHFNVSVDRQAVDAWMALSRCLHDQRLSIHTARSIRLSPHTKDSMPVWSDRSSSYIACIDIDARGVDARSPLYSLRDVTGIDERVQAVVAAQRFTAEALLEAVERIERDNLPEFGFVCRGATHRSVACCFLLAAIVYPSAQIYLSTRRTQQAARRAGLERRGQWQDDGIGARHG